ncbi:MAG: hypothetical protein IJO83_01505 [Clostridia bacterium]|nr:hypothetical protein [Clostridia bacterium]
MKTYSSLRVAHPTFFYKNYEISIKDGEMHVTYHFEIENLKAFSPSWVFPLGKEAISLDDENLKAMVFNLGLAELVSYWKITCSPNVVIECGSLTPSQTNWWKKLYFHGLGEFFYLNRINADESFMRITSMGTGNIPAPSQRYLSGNLIPVGGGKDSNVTMELLGEFHNTNRPYIINPRGATLDSVRVANLSEETLTARRTLDPNMLALNKEGYLNGHTPFSAIVAFSSVITAYVNNLKYVVLSNESSANESTVAGSTVNHQYSKSFEFEQDFNRYEKEYLRSGVYYFSLLRPLSEYQIASYFARLKQYHSVFRSCNRGSHTNVWCADCSKCLFVYLILSPFLSFEELEAIFGRNMGDDENLIPTFNQLIGHETDEKPFECVGSRDEVNFAICEAIRKNETLPRLFEYYKTTPLYNEYFTKENPYPKFYDKANLIPKGYLDILMKELSLLP